MNLEARNPGRRNKSAGAFGNLIPFMASWFPD
jgi:hypothetical protein